jgi:hypothetical protein
LTALSVACCPAAEGASATQGKVVPFQPIGVSSAGRRCFTRAERTAARLVVSIPAALGRPATVRAATAGAGAAFGLTPASGTVASNTAKAANRAEFRFRIALPASSQFLAQQYTAQPRRTASNTAKNRTE